MRHFMMIVLIISFSATHAQSFTYPSINPKGKTFVDFAPVGWTILDSAIGDLNKDGTDDAAIILQKKDSVGFVNDLEDTVMTQPRILLILFRNAADKTLKLVEQSNSFILKHDNSARDDPYQELANDKGVLEIKFHLFYNMGSWYVTNATYKFRYQKGQFVLIGTDYSSFHRATHDFEDYSYNFLTKKRVLTKGNENKGSKKTTWKTINIPVLKTLKTFIEPFTWEVEKDFYL